MIVYEYGRCSLWSLFTGDCFLAEGVLTAVFQILFDIWEGFD